MRLASLFLSLLCACDGGEDADKDDTDTDVVDTDETDGETDTDGSTDTDTDVSDSDGDSVPDGEDVCPGEQDLLDDDGNGTSDCVENLVDNGQMGVESTGWMATEDASVGHEATEDADDVATSGALWVTNMNAGVTPTVLGAVQCFTLAAETDHVARARAYLPSGQGAQGAGVQLTLVRYTSADCTGEPFADLSTSIEQTEDAWLLLELSFQSGIGAQSAEILLGVRKSANDPSTSAWFDNALVRPD